MLNLLVEYECKVILNLEGIRKTESIGISIGACGTTIETSIRS